MSELLCGVNVLASEGTIVGVAQNEPLDGGIMNCFPGGDYTTFNGRSGDIMPQAGDYTAEMVGADPEGSAAARQAQIRRTSFELRRVYWRETILNGETAYEQVVASPGEGQQVANNIRVDLRPNAGQMAKLISNGTTLMACNDEGTVTVYAIGSKPDEDLIIDADMTEVTE